MAKGAGNIFERQTWSKNKAFPKDGLISKERVEKAEENIDNLLGSPTNRKKQKNYYMKKDYQFI